MCEVKLSRARLICEWAIAVGGGALLEYSTAVELSALFTFRTQRNAPHILAIMTNLHYSSINLALVVLLVGSIFGICGDYVRLPV